MDKRANTRANTCYKGYDYPDNCFNSRANRCNERSDPATRQGGVTSLDQKPVGL